MHITHTTLGLYHITVIAVQHTTVAVVAIGVTICDVVCSVMGLWWDLWMWDRNRVLCLRVLCLRVLSMLCHMRSSVHKWISGIDYATLLSRAWPHIFG